MNLNNWSDAEAERASSTWGQKTPPYTVDMFNFAISNEAKSWLDIGCGFGRFLNFLTNSFDEPDYYGIDSSESMLKILVQNFPHYRPRVFVKDITSPLNFTIDSVICSAVLIHITLQDQEKVLNNVKKINPKLFTFDINSPSEDWLLKGNHFERHIRGSEGAFRMTWQSHYVMTRKILKLFDNYSLTTKFYTVQTNRNKVVYMLKRKNS